MSRRFQVFRDQAVWERESWWVEVPDDVDDPEEWIQERLDGDARAAFGEPDISILDMAVEGIDTDVTIEALESPADQS